MFGTALKNARTNVFEESRRGATSSVTAKPCHFPLKGKVQSCTELQLIWRSKSPLQSTTAIWDSSRPRVPRIHNKQEDRRGEHWSPAKLRVGKCLLRSSSLSWPPLISHPSGDSFRTVARLEFPIRAVPFRRGRNRLIASRASGLCKGEACGDSTPLPSGRSMQRLRCHPSFLSEPEPAQPPPQRAGEALPLTNRSRQMLHSRRRGR